MLPVATETGNITTEIEKLRAMSYNRGGNAINSYNQLNTAAMNLQSAGNGLRIPDLTGIINAGSAAVMDNLPFITDCAVCAGALGLAAANIVGIAAQPSVAMTTCLPTAGIGCIVAAAGAGLNAYSAIMFIALADPFCRNAASKVDDMETTTEKIRLYFESVAKIVNQVEKTDQSIENVKQKLDQLYRDLGNQAKPHVDKINTGLNRAHNALEKGKEILRTKVVPKINRYAGNRFQQMVNQAKQLLRCYENMERLSRSLTKDVVKAATDMQKAKGNIFDAGKILDNIVRQGQTAAKAGATFALKEWQACDSQEATLHSDIWGVQRGKVDAGKTAGHLAYLAANPSKISTLGTRVAQLKSREANIPFKAVDEGKKAFLNLAQSKANAGKLFDEAEVLASNAAKSIAKSQAKEKAKEQAAKQKSTSSSSSKVKAAEAAPMPSLNVKALDPKPVQK
jgi:peptidoglycan hydrolase CwlO-like protein